LYPGSARIIFIINAPFSSGTNVPPYSTSVDCFLSDYSELFSINFSQQIDKRLVHDFILALTLRFVLKIIFYSINPVSSQ